MLAAPLLAVSAFVAMLSGCGNDRSTTPPDSDTPTVGVPVATPFHSPTPVITEVPAVASVAVYTYNGPLGVMLETFDLNNPRIMVSMLLGDVQTVLGVAGGELLLAERGDLEAVSLDGANHRSLLKLGPDVNLGAADLSPDGSLIYVSGFGPYSLTNVPCVDVCRANGTWLALIDAGDGHELAHKTFTDLGLDWRLGTPPGLRWRSDGKGIVLHEVTDSEVPGRLATYFRDGSIVTYPQRGQAVLSPDGMLIADVPASPLVPVGCEASFVDIRDALTGKTLNSVEYRGAILRYRSWSSSSDAVLYRKAQPPVDQNGLCAAFDGSSSSWCRIPVDGASASCTSPGAQGSTDTSIYPGHSVDSPCRSEVHGTVTYFYCRTPEGDDRTQVTVDGVKVFDGRGSVELLGIVDPVAR